MLKGGKWRWVWDLKPKYRVEMKERDRSKTKKSNWCGLNHLNLECKCEAVQVLGRAAQQGFGIASVWWESVCMVDVCGGCLWTVVGVWFRLLDVCNHVYYLFSVSVEKGSSCLRKTWVLTGSCWVGWEIETGWLCDAAGPDAVLDSWCWESVMLLCRLLLLNSDERSS